MTISTASSNGQSQITLIPDVVFCTIGGIVWWLTTTDGKPSKTPVAKAKVQVKDTARATETDQAGRFKFKNLKPGQYTLVIQLADGITQERLIQVPPDYDVTIEEPSVAIQALQEPAPEPVVPVAPATMPAAETPEAEPPAEVPVKPKPVEPAPPKTERKRKARSTAV
ncbi:MAG: carboxypeptidase-like regulatory domain-containing protein [Chloroflexi bacterium]|nr:carboxypeptidase-like regulatory domain-containing protein [Chloroflexota bacterium]